MSLDSSVSIVTCYRMDRPGLESRRGQGIYISSSETVQTGSGAHLVSSSVGTGIISLGPKRLGSKVYWSKAWVCGRWQAGIMGSNPAGGMSACHDWCVLSGIGLCDGPIIHSEKSYRVWCVCVWCRSLNS